MASFAPEGRPVASLLLHAVAELPAVRVHMARGAGLILKSKRQNLVCAVRHPGLVALIARHSCMCARQHEICFLVLRYREHRAMKVAHGVAGLAAIVVWRAGELTIVRVLVAVRAVRKLHPVDRLAACRQMALRTVHAHMPAFQRVL